nr:hypothetical protein [Tanacetum cinerariifolium]
WRINLYLLMPHLQPYHRATLLTPIRRRMKRTRRRILLTILPIEEIMIMMSHLDDDDDDVEKDEEDKVEEENLAPANPSDVSTDDLETMTTVNQGMSVEEIEWIVAQRVANAIEAIAIYETKTNLARKTPATAKNQRTRTCYECGSLRHYKSECPIVKFHKRVDMIHGRVRASKPHAMQDAIEIATKLMSKKISTLAECQTKNKKRLDNTSKNNQNQQQPNKRQNTGRAYTAKHGEKKHYDGSKPLCFNCYYHHDGPCTGASQKATCYECGNQWHYRRDCLERKNQNHENQIKSTKARGVVHAFGGRETEQDFNNIEDEIEA